MSKNAAEIVIEGLTERQPGGVRGQLRSRQHAPDQRVV
jgi:hypothetical protein